MGSEAVSIPGLSFFFFLGLTLFGLAWAAFRAFSTISDRFFPNARLNVSGVHMQLVPSEFLSHSKPRVSMSGTRMQSPTTRYLLNALAASPSSQCPRHMPDSVYVSFLSMASSNVCPMV